MRNFPTENGNFARKKIKKRKKEKENEDKRPSRSAKGFPR